MIGVIGAGHMGAALVRSMASTEVIVCDRNPAKRAALAEQGVTVTEAVGAVLTQADTVLIAVKPSSFSELAAALPSDRLLISVMAGVSIARISAATGALRVVRAMPNLGVQIGEGVTAWYAAPAVTESERKRVEQLFSACGSALALTDEAQIDAVTALAGSGPAYFFELAALLTKKAEALGFQPAQARILAEGACRAAGGLLASDEEKTAVEWRDAVTSPGGTTAAALKRWAETNCQRDFFAAIDAAHARAEELAHDH